MPIHNVSHASWQGEVVVRVSAQDGDTGVQDDVFYTLEDAGNYLINGQLSFIIDAETGEISVNVTSLDRETHPFYPLTVTVGGPSLSLTVYTS